MKAEEPRIKAVRKTSKERSAGCFSRGSRDGVKHPDCLGRMFCVFFNPGGDKNHVKDFKWPVYVWEICYSTW